MYTIKTHMILTLVLIAIGLVGLFGWVRNIILLSQCDFDRPYKEEVIRAVGIPVGVVGAITGFMDLK